MRASMASGQRSARRNIRGFTLLELLIVLTMSVFISGAIAFAYSECVLVERAHEQGKANLDQTTAMEKELTTVIEGSQLSASATDTTSCFIGSNDSGGNSFGCDRLTVTTTAPGIPMESLYSTDDFATQQTEYGSFGGLTEVSLGTNPVGTAGDHVGLFEREQHPSDGDPTQGGLESDIDSDVTQMGFEFWDGEEWVAAWDTQTGTRTLPQAVQITYTLKGDTNTTPHVFVVPIQSSTINALNPVPNDGTAT
jgi:prepilin-type N-terminal cleavage/methylation domain-containing protein